MHIVGRGVIIGGPAPTVQCGPGLHAGRDVAPWLRKAVPGPLQAGALEDAARPAVAVFSGRHGFCILAEAISAGEL